MSYDFSGVLRTRERYAPGIAQEKKVEEFLRFFNDGVSEIAERAQERIGHGL
jgi:hypothetical protein